MIRLIAPVLVVLALAACGDPAEEAREERAHRSELAYIHELEQELDATRTALDAMTEDRDFEKATAENCYKNEFDACYDGMLAACGRGECPSQCRQ